MTTPGPAVAPPASIPWPVWLAPLIMLIAAIGPWPYGYYDLLRLVVCASAVYAAYILLSRDSGRGWVGRSSVSRSSTTPSSASTWTARPGA